MAARDKERYFWMKLHRGFFRRHDIRVLEKMQNGKELVLLYLKLMAESIDHEGALRFSDVLPYTEDMLASVTDTDPEILHLGLQVFQEFGLLEVLEDGTIWIPGAAKLLDSETYAAKRKREGTKGACGGKLPPVGGNSAQETESEEETEKETESDTESDAETETETEGLTVPEGTVCRPEAARRVVEAWNSLGLQQLVKVTASSKRGQMLLSRIREYGEEAVLEAIDRIRYSSFLKGQNEKGWIITFEWFVKPNNFTKVLEGNYDDRHAAGQTKTANPFLAMLLEEEE